MCEQAIAVLKFGSSVLRSEDDLPLAVREIARARGRGECVVAVVSAFGDTTDRLLGRANRYAPPSPAALAALLATGEAAASALLALALVNAGLPARVLDPVQAGLRTSGAGLDTELVGVDAGRIRAEARGAVVVLPGFVGRDAAGDTALLGRGGSDLTALFLAYAIGGRCVLLKDVDGLYTGDPALPGPRPRRFERATWEAACAVGGAVVQPKAVRFAEARGLRFTITAPGSTVGTEVGPERVVLASQAATAVCAAF